MISVNQGIGTPVSEKVKKEGGICFSSKEDL